MVKMYKEDINVLVQSHCGMVGNEEADRLANIGTYEPYDKTVITFGIVKAKRKGRSRWKSHTLEDKKQSKKEERQNMIQQSMPGTK